MEKNLEVATFFNENLFFLFLSLSLPQNKKKIIYVFIYVHFRKVLN